jgi:TM2 domain-containing membrane protein YozV
MSVTDLNGRPIMPGWYAYDQTMRWWDGEKWGVTREEYEASHGETLTVNFATSSPSPSLPPKSAAIAYLLMLFSLVGVCGIQHFYLGKWGRGFAWLFTFGFLGLGLIIDAFSLGSQTRQVNAQRAVGVR